MRKATQTLGEVLADFVSNESTNTKRMFNFDLFVVGLILISSFIFVAETYTLPETVSNILRFIDVIIIILFSIEYVARIYASKRRARYIFSIMGIVDLLAFVPFWLSFFFPWVHTLQFLRVLRVFKLFRFFKRHLNIRRARPRYVQRVLIAKILFVVFALLFVSSALIFTIESPQNPNLNTFDDAVYFSIVTVTTVGFGDITPVTRAGRMTISFIILLGILLIPVYIASLMKMYMVYYERAHKD